ncbi:MAG TPA: histidine phosphatase family protein [Alphaproteobacteria bacterium]|nr:histidine phosphatase family protein [Alphaproteobacteria bacterium]
MSAQRWWWVRHAPTLAPPGTLAGRGSDLPADLSDIGRLAALAARLPAGARALATPLRRSRETAAALGLAAPRLEPDFAEQDFGAWDGRRHDELAGLDPAGTAAFWANPAHHAPPDGESFAAMAERVAARIAALAAAGAEGDLIVVAHAGPIRAGIALALDLAPQAALRLSVAPLSLTRLDFVAGAWRVEGVNWGG